MEPRVRPAHAADRAVREPPNLAWHVFLTPQARALYRDWDAIAREQVSQLRAAAASCAHDETFDALVRQLRAESPDFARLWASHEVGEARRGVHRFLHPEAGPVQFDAEVLVLPDRAERRLVAYVPADEATALALHQLLEEPGSAVIRSRLRAV